jgi:hypothetical protein
VTPEQAQVFCEDDEDPAVVTARFDAAPKMLTAGPASEDPWQFAAITRLDWVVARSWRRLHALQYGPWTQEQAADIAFGWRLSGPVRLACGRTAAVACIPGVSFRLGLPRCAGCCRATGMPAGAGSPKNDDACRVILGLPAG